MHVAATRSNTRRKRTSNASPTGHEVTACEAKRPINANRTRQLVRQIVSASQGVLDIERSACRRVGIGSARR